MFIHTKISIKTMSVSHTQQVHTKINNNEKKTKKQIFISPTLVQRSTEQQKYIRESLQMKNWADVCNKIVVKEPNCWRFWSWNLPHPVSLTGTGAEKEVDLTWKPTWKHGQKKNHGSGPRFCRRFCTQMSAEPIVYVTQYHKRGLNQP